MNCLHNNPKMCSTRCYPRIFLDPRMAPAMLPKPIDLPAPEGIRNNRPCYTTAHFPIAGKQGDCHEHEVVVPDHSLRSTGRNQ